MTRKTIAQLEEQLASAQAVIESHMKRCDRAEEAFRRESNKAKKLDRVMSLADQMRGFIRAHHAETKTDQYGMEYVDYPFRNEFEQL
jgi:molecular chaperone GrpE (heat shock protein)